MSVLEKEIESKVCAYIEKNFNAITIKFQPPASNGWPDRMVMGYGVKTFFIEFKAPDKKITRLQQKRIGTLSFYGHRTLVIDNVVRGKDAAYAIFRT